MYTPESVLDLEERCLNEWWLLETVYGFAEDKLPFGAPQTATT
jgi:hypothetical protein